MDKMLKELILTPELYNDKLELRRILFLCSADKTLRKQKIVKNIALGIYPNAKEWLLFVDLVNSL